VTPFCFVHTAKKQITLKQNVSGGLTSSAEKVASWGHVERICESLEEAKVSTKQR